MRLGWFDRLLSFIYSIGIHVILAGILIFSFAFVPEPVSPPPAQVDIVQAVAVDERKVEAEINRLKEVEKKKRDAEAARQQELKKKAEAEKKKAEAAKKKRQAEEKRIAELRKQRAEEEKKNEEQAKRVAELKAKQKVEAKELAKLEEEKKQLEEKRKAEEERLKEVEKKRVAEEKRRIEEEKQKKLAEEKRIKDEKRRKAEEQTRLAELDREQKALDLAQRRQDDATINRYIWEIQSKVSQVFIYPEKGLSCTLLVQMIPGGDVVDAKVIESSGSAVFDRQAEIAVMKASPLPVPEDPRVFEKMRKLKFDFEP